ncbi:hypothetical protein SEUCBS140593_005942 [Sporothrix eucalyptigena]|uniref:Uncharacterized protein n=1 Tax=Sporothrix eucalyptigena TaxID=1812306 RepID=A0ABP0C308_9PEZI
MFVHGAIVASNAVLITSRHASKAGPGPVLKDTYFPALDLALSELSVSWELAGQARTKFRAALSLRQQRLQEQLERQLQEQLSSTATVGGYNQKVDDTIYSNASLTIQGDGGPASESVEVAREEIHPSGQADALDGTYSWDDPMNIVDGNEAYWADLDTEFFTGWDTQFTSSILDDAVWNVDS